MCIHSIINIFKFCCLCVVSLKKFHGILSIMTTFYNYILYNDVSDCTYNGYTCDINKRLRQHNGEISGGAGGTRRHRGKWKILALVTSPQFDKSSAMSFEWWVRYPSGKKPREQEFRGPRGRLLGLEKVMLMDKFKHMEFELYTAEAFT